MKSLVLIHIFLMVLIFNSFGQSDSDSIVIVKKFGTAFQHNGKNLLPKDMIYLMQNNRPALDEMITANRYYKVGFGTMIIGGAISLFTTRFAIETHQKINITAMGIGLGLFAISIPVSMGYTKHAKIAVQIYNQELGKVSTNNLNLKINFNCNSVGITMNF